MIQVVCFYFIISSSQLSLSFQDETRVFVLTLDFNIFSTSSSTVKEMKSWTGCEDNDNRPYTHNPPCTVVDPLFSSSHNIIQPSQSVVICHFFLLYPSFSVLYVLREGKKHTIDVSLGERAWKSIFLSPQFFLLLLILLGRVGELLGLHPPFCAFVPHTANLFCALLCFQISLLCSAAFFHPPTPTPPHLGRHHTEIRDNNRRRT